MLTRETAEAIIVEMTRTVRERWYEIARGVGVGEADCVLIAGAFAYPGFQIKSGN
jgi:serine/threonine-protein kinase HipA